MKIHENPNMVLWKIHHSEYSVPKNGEKNLPIKEPGVPVLKK